MIVPPPLVVTGHRIAACHASGAAKALPEVKAMLNMRSHYLITNHKLMASPAPQAAVMQEATQ